MNSPVPNSDLEISPAKATLERIVSLRNTFEKFILIQHQPSQDETKQI